MGLMGEFVAFLVFTTKVYWTSIVRNTLRWKEAYFDMNDSPLSGRKVLGGGVGVEKWWLV